MIKTYGSISLLLTLVLLGVTSRAAPAQILPAKIKSYLDKNYSGWRFDWERPGRRSVCGPGGRRSVVSGFFNEDARRDYAVKFVNGRSGYVIAFVAQGSDYKPHVLRSGSAAEVKGLELKVARRGERYYPDFTPGIDDANASFVLLKNDAVVTVPCASDAVAYYIYQNGRFR